MVGGKRALFKGEVEVLWGEQMTKGFGYLTLILPHEEPRKGYQDYFKILDVRRGNLFLGMSSPCWRERRRKVNIDERKFSLSTTFLPHSSSTLFFHTCSSFTLQPFKHLLLYNLPNDTTSPPQISFTTRHVRPGFLDTSLLCGHQWSTLAPRSPIWRFFRRPTH